LRMKKLEMPLKSLVFFKPAQRSRKPLGGDFE